MYRISVIIIIGLFSLKYSYAQQAAKKPMVMIFPSDLWCTKNGYMKEINNQGKIQRSYDYEKTFSENSELVNVVSKINGLMSDRGFPLEKLDELIKDINTTSIENQAASSDATGASVSTSAFDVIMDRVKVDIIIYVGWTVTQNGFNKSIQINIEAVDNYTKTSIAQQNPVGDPSATSDLPSMLSAAVLSVIDNFTARLQNHFDDLFANGRYVSIDVNKLDSWTGSLTSKYDYKGRSEELNYIIEEWFADNAVKGAFNTALSTKNAMQIKQVRIPMFNSRGRAENAKSFIQSLVNMLNDPPYNIPCTIIQKGIGRAQIMIGN